MSRLLHPDVNRSSSSIDTGAVGGMEVPRDEVAQRVLTEDNLLAHRTMDISHINLFRTAPSEHELGSSRQKFEDGLDVHPTNRVDRLSPASCRRRLKTPDTTPVDSSNHQREMQSQPRQVDAMTAEAEGRTDLLVIGVSVLTVLFFISPTMVVGLIVAMCTGRGGRPVSVEVAFSLHIVAYVNALLRPVMYYVFSGTLRQSLVTWLRCRRQSN